LFKSTNGGRNWSAVSILSGTSINALAIDPTMPSTLYVGTYDGGVFKSTDGGGNWKAINTGLTDITTKIFALAIDPATPTTLYAGTGGNGVFKTTNSGGK